MPTNPATLDRSPAANLRLGPVGGFNLRVATAPAPSDFQPNANALVAANRDYAESFADGDLAAGPSRHVAIVTCMDARVDISAALGLRNGEAHVIRNAGGVVTDDVIRSLCLSQRALGTREIVLVHHTQCGLQTVTEDGLKSELEAELGVRPAWAVESFTDAAADVRQSMKRIELSPFVPFTEHLSGFVYDVATGLLEAVPRAGG